MVLNLLFFIFAVYRLLKQVAQSKVVTTKVIVQSVSGYLLLGLVFSMAVSRLDFLQPGAFSFPVDENGFLSSATSMINFILHLSLWVLLDTVIFYPKLLLQNRLPPLSEFRDNCMWQLLLLC
jgi:hypothetical protein